MSERRITKIKRGDDRVRIEWEVVRDPDHVDEFSLSCTDPPRESFDAALQSIAPLLAEWLDVTKAWCETVRVIGVSLSWSNDTDGSPVMGATVTARRPCAAQSPLILNAPHRTEAPYSDGGDGSCCMTPEQINAIQTIIDEAGAYIEGNRATQADLPLDGEDSEDTGTEGRGSVTLTVPGMQPVTFTSGKEFKDAVRRVAEGARA